MKPLYSQKCISVPIKTESDYLMLTLQIETDADFELSVN